MFSIVRKVNAGSSRKSLFVKMLVSNFLLILLPVILWFALYTNNEQMVKTDAEHSNRAMLEQLRLHMDSNFKEVEQLLRQFMLNPKLRYLLENGSEDLSQHYQLVQFTKEYLTAYPSVVSNSFIYDFYIYLDRSRSVIKPNLVTDVQSFYNYYYHFDSLSFKEWQGQLLSYHNQAYLPASALRHSASVNEATVKVIPFMQSLPANELTDIKGNLTILIDESKIQDMTRQIELANQSSIYLVTPEHQLISSTPGAASLPDSLLNKLTSGSGFFNHTLNGQDVIVSYTTSKEVGWYYIAAMPTELYAKRMNEMKFFAFAVLSLFLLVGSIAAYRIAYRNYSPIKQIMETLSKGTAKPHQPSVNELDYIMEMVKLSWNEEKDVKHRLAQQLPLLRSIYLHRLMQGYFEPPKQLEQSLEFMEIHFPHPEFAVILVQIDSLSTFTPDQSEKQWALARFIIANLAEDSLVDLQAIVHPVELEKDRLALILNLAADPPDHQSSRIKSTFTTLHGLLGDRFYLKTSFAVSMVHQGLEQIAEAYLEATAALEYKLISREQSIFYFHSIRHEKLHYQYPVETELQLINCIRSGDKDQVVLLLTTLFDMNFRSERIAPELGRCLLFSLSGTLLRILNSDAQALRRFGETEINPVRLLLSCRSTDEMFAKTKELFVAVTQSFKLERRDHSEQLLRQIQLYIDENYADPNMSLNLLSEHLQITSPYISQFFKKMSGWNFSDYLTRVRINQSKKLMADTQLTNAQIASKVGYTSDTVFIRVFKKVEGLTPGKYRETVSGSNDRQDSSKPVC
ncbi:AraC family transcriptional regulator [Paenibacillus sp. PK3_47]|uniref:helix-turn-helix domain-containing protein n=1 Tax=Paenibacillus sp. PK3_47 TaxID=2072642 RepID=UPI00201D8E8A|nr:helix-turn-helix domain-containing protein [Paenibacillus sp. PK3_47]UQZ35791.1 AraC family transcriptional regulator [Paenibacillus sp. PK3_47]